MQHFISVTYGAGGSTRDLTHDLVERIQHTTKLDPIPHLTCICHKEEEIEAILLRYATSAIGNILALGGGRAPGIGFDTSPRSFPPTSCFFKFVFPLHHSPLCPDARGFWNPVARVSS